MRLRGTMNRRSIYNFQFTIFNKLSLRQCSIVNSMKIKNWSLKIPASRREAGDTIIEVVIATVIMGVILFSAYGLSNQSVKQGVIARERSQAAQLAQEQAEGLRALRDSASDWRS